MTFEQRAIDLAPLFDERLQLVVELVLEGHAPCLTRRRRRFSICRLLDTSTPRLLDSSIRRRSPLSHRSGMGDGRKIEERRSTDPIDRIRSTGSDRQIDELLTRASSARSP
jgi:hypothetical protein